MLHPPQTPKCGQRGVTRSGEALIIRSTRAFSKVGIFAITDELDLLTRQGTVDKNRLALQMRYTTRLVIQ